MHFTTEPPGKPLTCSYKLRLNPISTSFGRVTEHMGNPLQGAGMVTCPSALSGFPKGHVIPSVPVKMLLIKKMAVKTVTTDEVFLVAMAKCILLVGSRPDKEMPANSGLQFNPGLGDPLRENGRPTPVRLGNPRGQELPWVTKIGRGGD